MSVEQLDSAGNPTAKYTFHNLFPSEIAALELGDDQIDTISQFRLESLNAIEKSFRSPDEHPRVPEVPLGSEREELIGGPLVALSTRLAVSLGMALHADGGIVGTNWSASWMTRTSSP